MGGMHAPASSAADPEERRLDDALEKVLGAETGPFLSALETDSRARGQICGGVGVAAARGSPIRTLAASPRHLGEPLASEQSSRPRAVDL